MLGCVTTRFPFAAWRPTSANFTRGGVVRPPNGLVLHIAQGSFNGTEQWERNPNAKVSSYAVVGKQGQIVQEVDLEDKAWTQAAGNEHWIGVEFEGFIPDSLTSAQITRAAQILAFLHTHYGVPLQSTDDVNGHGLGYHSMGGHAWSPLGHTCPGPNIVAQRPQIIAAAAKLVHAPTPEAKVPDQFAPALAIVSWTRFVHPTLGDRCVAAVDAHGAVFCIPADAYLGGCNGKSYFVGRHAARIEPTPGGYQIVDSANEKYGPRFP